MINRRITGILMATAIAASAIAVGTVASVAADPTAPGALGTLEAPRDIAVEMTDELRFDPETIVVAEGETIRFLLHNPTAAAHDFLIGDLEDQDEHGIQMAMGMDDDQMAMGHDDEAEGDRDLPHAVTLQPGESTEVIATFDQTGELLIGCHVPGHWEAGMRGVINVLPAPGALGTLEAPRDIAVEMTDELRFDPETIVVAEGETIRFLLHNPTAAAHDFLIGDLEDQDEHGIQMAMGMDDDQMAMGHDDEAEGDRDLPHAVTLQPGESTEVIATFDQTGELLIGCHVPGHWEAGMRGVINVLPAGQVDLVTSQPAEA